MQAGWHLQSVDYIFLVFSVWFWEMGCWEFSSGCRQLLLCPSVSQSSLILTASRPTAFILLHLCLTGERRGVSATQAQAVMKNCNNAQRQQAGRSREKRLFYQRGLKPPDREAVDRTSAAKYRKVRGQLTWKMAGMVMEKDTDRTANRTCLNKAEEQGQSQQEERWQEREWTKSRDPSRAGMSPNERTSSLCSQEPYGAPADSKSDTEWTEVYRGSEEYSRFWGNCPRFEVRKHRKQNTCTLCPLWLTSTLPADSITISSLHWENAVTTLWKTVRPPQTGTDAITIKLLNKTHFFFICDTSVPSRNYLLILIILAAHLKCSPHFSVLTSPAGVTLLKSSVSWTFVQFDGLQSYLTAI